MARTLPSHPSFIVTTSKIVYIKNTLIIVGDIRKGEFVPFQTLINMLKRREEIAYFDKVFNQVSQLVASGKL